MRANRAVLNALQRELETATWASILAALWLDGHEAECRRLGGGPVTLEEAYQRGVAASAAWANLQQACREGELN